MRKVFLTAFVFAFFFTAQSQSKNFLDLPYIEVSGSADTMITPNEIFIKIVLSEKETKDKISIEEQENRMVDAFRSLGINIEKDLTTTYLSSNFKSYLLKGKDVLKAKHYSLRVKDAPTATKVFIALENLEIANSSIERVNHTELDNIRNQLRGIAIQNAKTRALALTKPLNQTIGLAIHIFDVENYNSNINMSRELLEEVVVTGYSRKVAGVEPVPDLEFRKINVKANVNVKFVLR